MAEAPQPPKLLDDFSGGCIRNVSKYKRPKDSSPLSINFVFDENVGEAQLRKGTSMIGNQIKDGNPILGLTNFRRRGDTNHALLAVVSDDSNNNIHKATNWAESLADDTKNLKTRFVQFLDSVMRINGTDGAKSFNGTSWIATAGTFDLANAPVGLYPLNYKDRVHILSEDGILYSSSVPRFNLNYDNQSSNFTVGARLTGGTSAATGIIIKDTDGGATGTLELGGITGDFQNNETITDDATGAGSALVNHASAPIGQYKISWLNNYITTLIDPDNGEKGKATGLGRVGGLMLIFFERAMYTWNGSSTEADQIVGIGNSSNESIAVDKNTGLLFFANEHGIYATKGGYPQKISRFMDDFFDNMSTSNYQHIASGTDGKHVLVSIGDVTLDEKTISNVVLRYTIASQEWAVLSYPTQPRVFSQYIDGTTVKLVYGDDDGNVIEIDSSAATDTAAAATTPINYEYRTRLIFEPLQGMNKKITERIITDTEESSGVKFLYKADKNTDRDEDFITLGEIKKDVQEFKIPSIQYKHIQFMLKGRSSKGRFRLKAIEIPNNKIHGY